MDADRSGRRLFEIDAVKFFAIFFMICAHVYEQFGSFDHHGTMPDSIYRNLVEFIGGPLAAPVFMFCMGIGMVYTRHDTPSEFIRRGLKLLITGYLLNFFRQTVPMLIGMALGVETGLSLIGGLLNVDILPFAGMAFITIGLLKRLGLKPYQMLFFAVILQGAGIWATKIDIPSVALATLVGLILPGGAHVAFSLMLWLVYPVLGILFGMRLKETKDRGDLYKKILLPAVLFFAAYSLTLLFFGYDIRLIYALYKDSYYNQTLLHTLWILPIILIAVSTSFFVYRRLENSILGRFMTYCSTNLTSIYITQWLLIGYGLGFFILLGFEATFSPVALTLGALVLMAVSTCITAARNAIRRRKKRA
ncbi:hypothetical protein SAMN06296952_1749 [Oscillospiraceae bacterium]|nr:hypothetical protein SAMN06296952_1749 [Oscillospiraceae bacterium]